MDETNVGVVRRFLDLILEGRMEDASALLSDDYVIREPPGLPYGGDYHGPGGFAELVGRLVEVVLPSALAEAQLRDAGDCVVVHAPSRFTSQATGASVDMDVVELYFVAGGKITKTDVYYKEPEAIAALVKP